MECGRVCGGECGGVCGGVCGMSCAPPDCGGGGAKGGHLSLHGFSCSRLC